METRRMDSIDLSGKTALVNGASRGIGEAIARGLAGCRATDPTSLIAKIATIYHHIQGQ